MMMLISGAPCQNLANLGNQLRRFPNLIMLPNSTHSKENILHLFNSLLQPLQMNLLSSSIPFSFPVSNATHKISIRKRNDQIVQVSKFGSFLDLEPKMKPQPLDLDLPWHSPSDGIKFDVVVIGAGPAGLRLSEQVSRHGINVCCLDPSPLSMWPNNYGVWVDEFERLQLDDCLDKTWPETCIYIDDHKSKHLGRAYGRVNRRLMKSKFLSKCSNNGVKFHVGKALMLEHREMDSIIGCDDGTELQANLVVDASGFTSSFVEYDRPRNPGYQIAHGILAEVDGHPFDSYTMVLMDWRDSHLLNEPSLRAGNLRFPTFLYVMPFDSNLLFLEETSLVARPVLSYEEVKKRMDARLRHLGIRVRAILEDEKCFIPMGGPLPKVPQSVMAMGGNSGLVHPASGYAVAQTMKLAPVVASVIAECLGSGGRIHGTDIHRRVWGGLWPRERRWTREFYNFGMETLLKLDLEGTRRFFDTFFELDPLYWHGFTSWGLSFGELVKLGTSLFWHASTPSRVDMITKCPWPLVRMMGNIVLEAI